MKPVSSIRKSFLSLSLSLSLFMAPAAALAANATIVQEPTATVESALAAEYELFLQEKFGISVSQNMTKGDFIEAVAQIVSAETDGETEVVFSDLASTDSLYPAAAALYQQGILAGPAVNIDEPLTPEVAIWIAVRAAGLKELAYTYPQEKVEKALSQLNLDASQYGTKPGQELAAAVDTGLLPVEFYGEIATSETASSALSNVLLGQVLSFTNQYKQYIGYVSDPNIFAQLYSAYATSDLIQSPELQEIVDTALKQDKVTGYNLKDSRYDSNFVDSLSLTYGHDNIKHAIQLIGLLRSEGLDAKVQFEPKTSAFIYLSEWGEPVETDNYKVVQIENGNYIAYAKEYDISFEFNTVADKAKFQDIILAYAKKNSDDTTGLIASSWWQPLYYSMTELDDYKMISNHLIQKGNYYAQSFSLNEASEDIVESFQSIDPSVQVKTYQFWVDEPFYNYLTGGYM